MLNSHHVSGVCLALVVGLITPMVSVGSAGACEIEVKVVKGNKDSYAVGNVVIVAVDVFLTHNNCPEGIKATNFRSEGIKVLGAKKWKQTGPERYRRLLKAKIESAENGSAALHVRRTCDKEGAYGVLTVNVSDSAHGRVSSITSGAEP